MHRVFVSTSDIIVAVGHVVDLLALSVVRNRDSEQRVASDNNASELNVSLQHVCNVEFLPFSIVYNLECRVIALQHSFCDDVVEYPIDNFDIYDDE